MGLKKLYIGELKTGILQIYESQNHGKYESVEKRAEGEEDFSKVVFERLKIDGHYYYYYFHN